MSFYYSKKYPKEAMGKLQIKKRKGGIKICSNEETTDNIHKTTQELKKEDETNY